MLTKDSRGVYQIDLTVEGQRVRKSTRTKDKKLAEQLHALTEADLLKGAWGMTKGLPKVTLKEAFRQAMLSHWKGAKAAHSVQTNWDSIAELVDVEVQASAVNGLWLNELVTKLRGIGNSNATINRKLALMSKLLRLCQEWGYIDAMPKVPRLKEPPSRHRELTPAEEQSLMLWLEDYQPEMQGLYVFLLEMGNRLSEVLGLEWKDITEATVTFIDTKSGDTLTKPLTEGAKRVLELRRGLPKPFPYSIWLAERVWREWKEDTGIKDDTLVIHTLRHTCASRLAGQGVDLLRIQSWLGHKSYRTTLRYAQLKGSHLVDVAEKVRSVESARGLSFPQVNPQGYPQKRKGTTKRNSVIPLGFLAPRPGLEPGTHGLTVRTDHQNNQSVGRESDLNPTSLEHHSDTLKE